MKYDWPDWPNGGDDAPPVESVKRTGEFDVPRASPASGARVLVVDDDPDICEALKEVLEESGFETVCVSNGQAALDCLRDNPCPALILLDLMMPTMNGWTFVERMRSMRPVNDTPIVVMTASGPHWGYPVAEVLRKPIGRNELLAAVRAAVVRRSSFDNKSAG